MKNKYHIIITQDNKEIETLRHVKSKTTALRLFNKLVEENKNEVIFPVKYVNTKGIFEVNFNIVLIKEKEYPNEAPIKLRNEYGEYVEHNTSSDDWYVYDIAPYNKEEEFWVYGYNPKTDRKTFLWIFDNIIKPYASNSETFLNVKLYKNKIVLVSCYEHNMIICKNKSDAIRFYNMMEKYCNEYKLKYIMFSGDYSANKTKVNEIIEEIKSFTHWNNRKITRHNTRP